MLLEEAKEILEKNGYIVEDAYTDAMDAEDDEVLRKLRNDTPDYVPKLDKILLNLDFVKLHKQVKEDYLSYIGFIEGTKYLLHFMIDKDDVITCNVVDKDKRKVQKVTMDIAIDSDNYDREYINVNEFIKNSDSYLDNIKKVVKNVKKIDRSSKTTLGRIANGITKALGNDFDTRYSGLRDIGEAVKLLKKNGYRLVEDTEDSEDLEIDKLNNMDMLSEADDGTWRSAVELCINYKGMNYSTLRKIRAMFESLGGEECMDYIDDGLYGCTIVKVGLKDKIEKIRKINPLWYRRIKVYNNAQLRRDITDKYIK